MSDDSDDAALLAALLATLDGDGGESHTPALVDSSSVGLPPSGGFSCADSDVGGPRLLLEAGDATLDLLTPPLEFSSNTPIDAAAALQNLFPRSKDSSVEGSGEAATPATPTTTLETGGKFLNVRASSSTTVAVRTQGKKEAMKRNYDPNKARNERAKEIQGLRREVEDLTDQVKALQALDDHDANSEKCLPTESSARQETASTALTGAPPLWETICRNQLARRVCAERENVRLKRALDEHVNITKSLQRLIEKSNKVQKTIGGLDACSSRRVYSLPSDSDADTEMFDKLVAEVDASHFEADGVFELNGIHEPSDKARRGRNMREGEHGRRFVDMFAIDFLPFSVDATADVVWKFYSGPNKHRGPLYYKTAKALELSEDTIMEKFAIELSANNTRADFRIWQVLRRYVDADRVLVVWMCVVEPIEFANKSFTGCGFREKGYIACSSASNGGGTEIPGFTRLQRCHRVVPYLTHSAGVKLSKRDKREIGAIIDFHLSLDSISVHLQMFQDELMQQSLRQHQETVD